MRRLHYLNISRNYFFLGTDNSILSSLNNSFKILKFLPDFLLGNNKY